MRVLVLALLAVSLARAQAPAPVPLDSLARAAADSLALPSVVVGLSVGGQRWVVGEGAIDSLGTVPDGHTLYEIGSVSKVLTALALADAVARGEVALDTPIRTLLPGSPMVPQHDAGPITLRQLSAHTSGLPRLFLEMGFQPGFSMADPYALYDVPAMLAALSRPRAETAPGEAWAYSNVGVGLLGYALGQHAGTGYTGLVAERVLAPLGMAETVAEVPDSLAARFPDGHGAGVVAGGHWTFTEATVAAGGWRSTAADLLTLGEAAARPEASPLAEALALTLTPQHRIDERRQMGLGWFLASAPGTAAAMAQHSGGTGGFRSFLAVVPEAGVVVVVLANRDAAVDALGFEVLRRALASR